MAKKKAKTGTRPKARLGPKLKGDKTPQLASMDEETQTITKTRRGCCSVSVLDLVKYLVAQGKIPSVDSASDGVGHIEISGVQAEVDTADTINIHWEHSEQQGG